MSAETVFYLIRHGEAEQNIRRILDSFPGNPVFGLTERGREQVHITAGEVARSGADFLFSSPMRRTRETSEIVSAACGGLTVVFDYRLREADLGIWNGTPLDVFRGSGGKYHDPLLRIGGNSAEGLECARSQRERLSSFLCDILRLHEGGRIVVVSHGDPIAQLYGILMGEDVAATVRNGCPETGSLMKLSVPIGFRETMLAREQRLREA